jgi:hypothetical protein
VNKTLVLAQLLSIRHTVEALLAEVAGDEARPEPACHPGARVIETNGGGRLCGQCGAELAPMHPERAGLKEEEERDGEHPEQKRDLPHQ